MADALEIKARIQSYVDTFSAGDRAGWLKNFSADATLEDPVGSGVRKGAAEIGEFWDTVHSLASEMRLVPDRPIAVCANEAILVFHAESKVGDMTMVVDIVDHFVVDDDGLIAAQRAFWDPATMRPVS